MENKDEQISTEIKPTQILEGKTKKGLHIIETKKKKNIVAKKTDKAIKLAKKTKDNILDNIFSFDYITKEYGIKTSSKIIFILFLLLLFTHLSFGYTISTKRVILLGCLITSFFIIYLIHNFIFVKFVNSEYINEKIYEIIKKYYPFVIFILFIVLSILLFKRSEKIEYLTYYKFVIPQD